MAVVMDQHQSFKYFCRICKKGFGCGRALGGHMRAHGIGDDGGHVDDDDPASDWEEKLGGNPPAGSKRMYALRTNPDRLKSCRICKNCGKEFASWKLFLEHGKCSSDDAGSLVSSPEWEEEEEAEEAGDEGGRSCGGWSKGKRSRRVVMVGNPNLNCPSSEEEDLANCLVMLSAARVDPLVVETEESCASASKEEERHRNYAPAPIAEPIPVVGEKAKGVTRGMFECKACKKVFNSHQALGGHRASHKKVKGCFAAKLEELDENMVDDDVITHEEFSIAAATTPSKAAISLLDHETSPLIKRKHKVHECSICHRVFASGQALGGHKRCHWVTSSSPDTSIAKLHQLQDHNQQLQLQLPQKPKLDKSEPLDLNLPAQADDVGGSRRDNVCPLSLELPTATALYLQQWIGIQSNNNNNSSNSNNNHNNDNPSSMLHGRDEADSGIKLAKLSDLKDMKFAGASTPWLQVGIGSTTTESSTHEH
ncbi:zinc finger protein ZAT9-like protein [Cinnamomum micranthum f. kanehirae]|uniref:Zinc finger protein ZAT9-like protein n=1 Tax=Cinnamomum micranthum f. kanehirae TaxID=337451 RepID=A0A3S3PAJ5_9MAGN|nr:zinc finger protein ZAT9-like protein [Cinnamomum micranthum f. kanehirae]